MIKIRKARHSDVNKITELWCEFIELHASFDNYYRKSKNGNKRFAEFIEKQISNRNSLVLVAIIQNQICGYLFALKAKHPPVFEVIKYGFISDVAVSRKFRRKGIGKFLYDHAIEWFKKHNIEHVELSVATTNPISNNFWKKLGFKPYYERRHLKISD